MDAIYILSPQTHIVDCLVADFERRKYKKYYLVWTSELNSTQEKRLQGFRPQIGGGFDQPCLYAANGLHGKQDSGPCLWIIFPENRILLLSETLGASQCYTTQIATTW